jgi:glutamate formiminotransferase
MVPVLEAVPNFSAGRDLLLLERLVRVAEEAGTEVLDASADADHNRSVVTLVGPPERVADACVGMARLAVEAIDLREHVGVHPRIGALDVLPLVPLLGMDLSAARRWARRVGARLAKDVGIPVYFYAEASDPPGRMLAELRRGGFETLGEAIPEGREPDLLPDGWPAARMHPTAGAACVGARPLLLAWNVDVAGLDAAVLGEVAAAVRERDHGFPGVRALGLVLAGQDRMQVSMNVEDVRKHQPFQVFRALESEVGNRGGRVVATEVVGLIPEELLLAAGADRMALLDPDPSRVLSSRVLDHVARRAGEAASSLVRAVDEAGGDVPARVRDAAERLRLALIGPVVPDEPE